MGVYTKNCDEFALAEVCTEQYEPVCGKVDKSIIEEKDAVKKAEWKTFSNACMACTQKEEVNWYKSDECED